MFTFHTRPRIGLMLTLTAIFILLGTGSVKSQSRTTSNLPVYSGTLEEAVRAATVVQYPAFSTAAMFVSVINQQDSWVFGTNGIEQTTTSSEVEVAPQILLFFAQQQVNGWSIAIEHSSSFTSVVAQLPQGLLTPEQLATMQPPTRQTRGDGSMQLSLPWPVNETVVLTQGPHENETNVRSSLDFSGGSRIVQSAREGVAYVDCGSGSDYVRIDHGGGLITNYYHLANISVANGQAVGRNQTIGRQGNTANCIQGASYGDHLHFWITRNGAELPIHGIDIGGWTVENGPRRLNANDQPYWDGCLIRISDDTRRCASGNGAIYNDGTVGNGTTTFYRGQYISQTYQTVMVAGSTQIVRIQVENIGTSTWDSNTKIAPIPRDQSSPFYDPATWESDKRITSAGVVAPGEAKTFEFSLRAPTNPGQYNLQFGFLQEGVTWFEEPSDGMIYFPIDVRFAVGAGSSRQQFFVDAYNRNGGSARLGYPVAPATWSGIDSDTQRAVIQGLDSGAVILHNEQSDMPPNTVPAYVLSGQLLQHFRSVDGSRSWLGAGPTSDQFTNSVGQLQSSFPNGYIVSDGSTAQAVAWPKSMEGQWYAEYHNGKNLNAGATWVQNEASIDYNWGEGSPGQNQWGVWADDFSVRWTGQFVFAQGKYTFTAGADDRLRIWIDDKLMIDAWEQIPPYSQNIFSMNMTSGTHAIRVEYGENFGSGAVKFIWKQNIYNMFLPIAVE